MRRMDFRTFFFSLGVDDRDRFASDCGTTRKHLNNIAYGYRPCGEALAISIERESCGAVRCEELRPDVDWEYLRGTEKRAA